MKDVFALLEFDRILDELAVYAHAELTARRISEVRPLPAMDEIINRHATVSEIRRLANLGIRLPLERFDDISRSLELCRPVDAVLSSEELMQMTPVLRMAKRLRQMIDYREDVPLLTAATHGIKCFPEILETLEHSLGPDGELLDRASPTLARLRREQKNIFARVKKRLEEIVREREVAIFLQDDFITQRNGRWVIPVRMDSKGMVPGVVHDVSRTGETAFMEPVEIVGLSNELENITAQEKAEQIRILREITGWIRGDADDIHESLHGIVDIDLHNSIALFSDSIEAHSPRISAEMELAVINGYHPLLLLIARREGLSKPVPLTIAIGESSGVKGLLITGPNTGGKTIALKSTGLLTLMAQSGIPVPADETSIFPGIAKVAADIGDEQSIAEKLSTFSAHISNMTAILKAADSKTLVLLDELGTGTDPRQGGAIACAYLSDLMQLGSTVVATTHLVDIVAFVQKSDSMINSSMAFDSKTLSPLYRLTPGEPGESHAFDIARRCGLPDRIICSAKEFAGKMESEFYQLLTELKRGGEENRLLRTDLAGKEQLLAKREAELEARLSDFSRISREAREKALLEARSLLDGVKAEINRIVAEARKEKASANSKKIIELEQRLEDELSKLSGKAAVNPHEIRVGDTLFVKRLARDAMVIAIDLKHGKARVRAGNVEIDVPVSLLAPSEKLQGGVKGAVTKISSSETRDSQHEINLIGHRLDEGMVALERFIDDAMLNGLREIRIIHGIGKGVLMREIRSFLKDAPYIDSFRAGEGFEGGNGITVVRFIE